MRWFIGALGALALLAVLGLMRGDTGRGDGLALVVVTDHITPGASCPPNDDNGSFKTERWAIGEDMTYLVNAETNRPVNLSASAVVSAIDAGFNAWNSSAMGDKFSNDGSTDAVGVDLDGINTVSFAPLSGSTIASTAIWIFTRSKQVAEFDIVFDNELRWANLVVQDCDGDDFDLQAIATHEVGHPVGAGHTSPNGSNNAQTMYPFGAPGTIFERTLASGDLAAAEKIYGVGGGGGGEDDGPPCGKGWKKDWVC